MITRELDIGVGATQHHLDILEKSGKKNHEELTSIDTIMQLLQV